MFFACLFDGDDAKVLKFTQMIVRLGRWYLQSLNKHPWKTQLITSGCLAGTGDLLAQFAIEKRTFKRYDVRRTARFFGLGCFFIAPILRTWFGFLSRHVHLRVAPKLSPLLRVLVDQFLFAPCLMSSFLILLRLLEGNDLVTAGRRWRNDVFDIYITGLKVWPPTQIMNFYFVPLQYQMLVVQTVALFWNSYLAWRTNKHTDLTGTITSSRLVTKLYNCVIKMVFVRNLFSTTLGSAWRSYQIALEKKPLLTQMISTGALMGTGDLISQFIVEKKSLRSGYDPKRTIRFFGLGCFYVAPLLRQWFIFLERKVHVRKYPKLSPVKRMLFDQLLAGPVLTSVFLVLLRMLEGHSLETSVYRWRRDFPDIFVTGLMVWPAAQLFNFYLIPLQYRILYVQTLALMWNTYLAWRTNVVKDPIAAPVQP